jgi:hypothetical protein
LDLVAGEDISPPGAAYTLLWQPRFFGEEELVSFERTLTHDHGYIFFPVSSDSEKRPALVRAR